MAVNINHGSRTQRRFASASVVEAEMHCFMRGVAYSRN